jgi:hypothetical protein
MPKGIEEMGNHDSEPGSNKKNNFHKIMSLNEFGANNHNSNNTTHQGHGKYLTQA